MDSDIRDKILEASSLERPKALAHLHKHLVEPLLRRMIFYTYGHYKAHEKQMDLHNTKFTLFWTDLIIVLFVAASGMLVPVIDLQPLVWLFVVNAAILAFRLHRIEEELQIPIRQSEALAKRYGEVYASARTLEISIVNNDLWRDAAIIIWHYDTIVDAVTALDAQTRAHPNTDGLVIALSELASQDFYRKILMKEQSLYFSPQ